MKLFRKILSKEASLQEKEGFYSSIKNDAKLKDEYLDIQNLWHLAHIKDRKISQHEKKLLFDEFWHKRGVKETKSHWWIGLQKYAASVFIALIVGMGIQYLLLNFRDTPGETYVYQSEKGSVSTVVLPDSSKVWMNSDSKLEITNKKGIVTAKLWGEAYFDIKHNENRAFIVDVGAFKIRDLGTKFNVKAYQKDNCYRAALLEGDIDVLNNKDKMLVNVNPGQGVVYNKTSGILSVHNMDTSIESAWTQGKFVFVKKSLDQMCEDLEKWYNVDFQIQDEELALTQFTCVLKKTTTVEQVLKILKVTSDVDYILINNKKGKDIVIIK